MARCRAKKAVYLSKCCQCLLWMNKREGVGGESIGVFSIAFFEKWGKIMYKYKK